MSDKPNAPREPTEAMLTAARDWSRARMGAPIGNDAARSCWQVMFDASDAIPTAPVPEGEIEAAAQSELVEAEREACAKIFDDEQKDALRQIDENIAYTRRIGRGDDLWSPSNELCRDRARWNESAAAKIRARTALDAARGKS